MNRTDSRAHAQDHAFFSKAGTTIATWGLGFALMLINTFASAQVKALPIFLGPIAAISLLVAIFSKDKAKCEDSSHIHLLALAGCLAPFQMNGNFYYILATAMVLLNLRNSGGWLTLAPMGPSILFVAWLSHSTSRSLPVMTFCLVMLVLIVIVGRREKIVANSVFPLLASLYMLSQSLELGSFFLASIAFAHIGVVLHLKSCRMKSQVIETERRAFLDKLIIAFALTLTLRAILPFGTHVRDLLVAFGFLVFALTRPVSPSVSPLTPADVGDQQHKILTQADLNFRGSLVVCAIFFSKSAIAWPLLYERLHVASLACAVVLSFGLFLYGAGRRSGSPILRDGGKLLMAYAVLEEFSNLSSRNLEKASLEAFFLIAVLHCITIGVAVYCAGKDLEIKSEGAWKGIFSGRALAMIRRARSRVFEVITKAPVIGWIFHLADKAASNLQGTFGKSKVWTISHYCICFVIAIGALSTDRFLEEFFVNREALFGIDVFTDPDPEKVKSFRVLLIHLASTFVYIGIIFFVGSVFRLRYLRALAFVLASFILAIQAFLSLSDKAALSIFFYPLAFCCVMALFRVLYDRPDKESLKKARSE